MVEKTNFENSQAKKERFEFVLTVNGNIICQRYFRINNFKEKSLSSVQLSEAIETCVSYIDNDLRRKSDIYLYYTSPQLFKNREEMDNWIERGSFNIEVPCFVVLNDTEETFVWNGEKMTPYDKAFNTSDYVIREPDSTCILKFSFLDNGKEIHSVSWDGNVYPKFVRSNIDISNSKNKYKAEGIYAPTEEFIVDKYIEYFEDVIPVIVKKICNVCSKSDASWYEKYVDYGGRKYSYDISGLNYDYEKKYEAYCRKKN